MKEFIEKLIGRLEEVTIETLGISKGQFAMDKGEYSSYCSLSLYDVKEQANQLAEEYQNDNLSQLSNKYWKCLTKFGVDITEKWETATQNAIALEQAYIRGRQDERDRFTEWREEHNNGWIPCSERLPEVDVYVLCQGNHSMFIACVDSLDNKWRDCHFITRTAVKAWQPLPQPYKPQKLEWKDKVMKHFTNVE